MSMRTLVEINHDYLGDLLDDPEAFKRLLMALRSCELNSQLNKGEVVRFEPGIRVVLTRHHSDIVAVRTQWVTRAL